jgi:hypothetical protein
VLTRVKSRPSLRFSGRTLFYAWAVATAFSGVPSTVWALVTGSDPLEATWAAGAMLVPADSGPRVLFASAALVHSTVSLFWALVFGVWLPRRHVALWALCGAAVVALIDLGLIAPLFFPSVAALAFWPQFMDHLMWGACLGGVLQLHRSPRRR